MIALDTAWGLGAALGGGLLIGLERERRKGHGEHRGAAGIRSFALAALGGAVAQALGQPLLVAMGAALVAALAAVAYWHSRQARPGAPAGDPGLTSELALFITYLVGVLSVQQPALGTGSAVVVAVLLAAREPLHTLATERLSRAELHDALVLAALALVLLPLLPATPWAWLGGVSPRKLLLTVLLILGVQAVGHVALRLLGPRAGLALSGWLSGFVSSTATIAALGSKARAQPALGRASLAGALASTVATWLQAALLIAALAPAALGMAAPPLLAGAVTAAACAAWAWRRAAGAPAAAATQSEHGPLRLREALWVAALLSGVATLASWAHAQHGAAAVLATTVVAGMADAHAPVAALAHLQAGGRINATALLHGTLLAMAANSLSRTAAAWVAGGRRYALSVGAALLLAAAAAGLADASWR